MAQIVFPVSFVIFKALYWSITLGTLSLETDWKHIGIGLETDWNRRALKKNEMNGSRLDTTTVHPID